MNEELEKKINGLNEDELRAYNNAATLANTVISVLGMGTILFVLNIPNFFTVPIGIILVYTFSSLSVAMCDTRKYIKEKLKKYQGR